MSNKINVSFTFCSSYLSRWKFKRKKIILKNQNKLFNKREQIKKKTKKKNVQKILRLELPSVVVVSGARQLK